MYGCMPICPPQFPKSPVYANVSTRIHKNKRQVPAKAIASTAKSDYQLSKVSLMDLMLPDVTCYISSSAGFWFLLIPSLVATGLEPVTKLISIKNNWIGGAKGISRAEARQNDKIMGFLVAQTHKQGHKKYMWFIT